MEFRALPADDSIQAGRAEGDAKPRGGHANCGKLFGMFTGPNEKILDKATANKLG